MLLSSQKSRVVGMGTFDFLSAVITAYSRSTAWAPGSREPGGCFLTVNFFPSLDVTIKVGLLCPCENCFTDTLSGDENPSMPDDARYLNKFCSSNTWFDRTPVTGEFDFPLQKRRNSCTDLEVALVVFIMTIMSAPNQRDFTRRYFMQYSIGIVVYV
jgi:hypothetical protein